MEQRLIDANELIEILAGMQAVCNSHAELVGISKVWQQVKNMPTIEAEPVRHGKWLVCGTDEWEHFYALRCSECYGGYHLKYEDTITWRYCPDCGARMDENETT